MSHGRGGWPRLTFGHHGHLMNGSHVRNRGTQIEESGIFSAAEYIFEGLDLHV